MNDFEILTRLLLAISFGAILGLETETRLSDAHQSETERQNIMRQRIGGVRTYTVLALFGAIAGVLFQQGHQAFIYLTLVAALVFMLIAYALNIYYEKAFGITTEIATLIVVIIGFAATSNIISLQILLVLIVLLTFILSQKAGVARLVKLVAHEELNDVIVFAIAVIVIFPFLPNQNIYLTELLQSIPSLNHTQIPAALADKLVVLNPFQMWKYVVLISGFNLMGYFVTKFWRGSQGLILTSFFAGFVSSTATVISLAQRSRTGHAHSLAAAALVAHSASFIQIMALASGVGGNYLQIIILPALGMLVGSLVVAAFLERGHHEKISIPKHQPFSLVPAIKFSVLLTTVGVLVQVLQYYLGPTGLVSATTLSGLVGMDVANITLGTEVLRGDITLIIALIAFCLANFANFIAKIVYAKASGTTSFTKLIALGMLGSATLGLVGALIALSA